MKQHTERLRLEFADVVRNGNDLAARLDDAVLMRRPAPESWSVAENLEHLSATAETYGRRIRRKLDATDLTSSHAHAHAMEEPTFIGRIWLSLVEPPVRFRLKVPAAALQPGAIESREILLTRFADTHAKLIALLEESDAHDRMKVRVPTAFAKRITVTLLDAFAVLTAHGRRHLWQAERALRKL